MASSYKKRETILGSFYQYRLSLSWGITAGKIKYGVPQIMRLIDIGKRVNPLPVDSDFKMQVRTCGKAG